VRNEVPPVGKPGERVMFGQVLQLTGALVDA
jgi:hypothetical protein